MASLLVLPSRTDAFSQYKPSKNAHVDFITHGTLGKKLDGTGGSSSSMADKTGPRVIKITPPALTATKSTDDQLVGLLSSIPLILSGKPTTQSYHLISSICHQLVLPPHDKGDVIFDKVEEELTKSVSAMAREWRAMIMSRDKGWLQVLVDGWRDWEKRVGLLSAVLVYLDRVYSNGSNDVLSIRDFAIVKFRNGIWKNDIIFKKTRDDVLDWATSERDTSQPDSSSRPTIAAITHLAKLLSEFTSLTTPYSVLTQTHYAQMAMKNVESVQEGTMSVTRYVEMILQKVIEERERAKVCLDGEEADKAVEEVRLEGGTKMGERIVRRALDEAMDASDAIALRQLYLFSVDCQLFPAFARDLRSHIQDRLCTLISDPENDPQMIDGTLNLKRFTDKSIRGLFSKHRKEEMSSIGEEGHHEKAEKVEEEEEPELTAEERKRLLELEDAIRVGFKAGMGSRQNAPAEWIAKHLDIAMRRGQGSGTEAEFNAFLDEIIALIGFAKDKDVFKAFYSTQLAKRLLLNKSASDDMERNMIVKLQKEMGEEFTSGDVMMKDLTLSETLVKSYQSAQAKNPTEFKDAGNFTANVLTESAWPAYPLLKNGWAFKLTPQLQSSIDQFTSWYATQHKNRQLSWRWQLATVSLSARFPSGKYEIGVSLFQAVTLLQFNDEDSMSVEDLKARTGIETSELVRTVQSLSMGRKGTRVLLKKPPVRHVDPTDQLTWNKAFTSDRIKFRINQIQQDLSAEESRKTNEQVAVDRVSVLEATIVRIMKARKKMTLQLLIDAVVTDVNKRFPPDVKEIKKRVESLIEREFFMRDEEDRNLLHYLA